MNLLAIGLMLSIVVAVSITITTYQVAQARTSLGDYARGRENGIQAGKLAFENGGGSNVSCPDLSAYCLGWNQGFSEGKSAAEKLSP